MLFGKFLLREGFSVHFFVERLMDLDLRDISDVYSLRRLINGNTDE